MFPIYGTKFGHLCTKDGLYIGSKWIKKNNDWSQINYSVVVCTLINGYNLFLN